MLETGVARLQRVRAWVELARTGPDPQVAAEMRRTVYRLWALAFLLKMLGATWDVSWHFKWLRDDFAPPHLLNTVGTTLAVALVLFHTYTRFGIDRLGLRLLQSGCVVFLVSIPLDVVNHRVNGLDITTWSVTHSGLYLGTALMIAAVIRGWSHSRPPGREGLLLLGAYWVFFFENVLFPNQHQEYGVLSLRAWDRGRPYAEPSLLHFAAQQIGRPVDHLAVLSFALPIPSWVYPVWAGVAGMGVLVAARVALGRRLTATAIAGAYVAYRCVLWLLLTATTFPPSAVPFALLAGAVVIDGMFAVGMSSRTRAVVGAVAVTTALYAGWWLQGLLTAVPPVAYGSYPIAAGLLGALWLGVEAVARYAGRSAGSASTAAPVG